MAQAQTLGSAEIVVQDGTNHQWENKTDERTQLYAVLLPAHNFIINGKALT